MLSEREEKKETSRRKNGRSMCETLPKYKKCPDKDEIVVVSSVNNTKESTLE